ncbi:MAG: hypothetical protein MPN21_09945 [Thermoanaerobaculia bacterium]|nr:hypothetical protein [Thermoanaerobaculia bacterium]
MSRHAATWPVVSILLLLTLASAPSHAEVITVGPTSSGCEQSSLALAFLRAAATTESDTILFAVDQTWTGGGALLLTNESPVVLQGINSCSDFTPRLRSITTTVGDLFEFDATQATFRNMRLVGDTGGRLITATNSSLVTLEDTLVVGGRANDGGNVHLSGGASLVALAGTQIFSGEATFNGGGVYCTGTGVVGLGAQTKLHGNDAGFNGGGVYADGCSVNVLAGGPAPAGINHYGIVENRAEFNGGGIYARGGSSVFLGGNSLTPATLRRNDAVGFGGGMYLLGSGTSADVFNSEIVSNRGLSDGGGVMVTSQATLVMDRTTATCDRGVRCSLMEGNSCGGAGAPGPVEGGALLVTNGGQATVRQTYLTGNSAEDAGNVAVVSGTDSFLLVENSVLYDNHAAGVHVLARDGGHARLAFVSAWGSSAPSSGMAFAHADVNGRVDIYSSVVIEGQGMPMGGGPGSDPIFLPAGSGGFQQADCALFHENASSHSGVAVETDPSAVWDLPSSGDPHLRETAPAVDFCDTVVYVPTDDDIDGDARGFDVTSVPDQLGPYDLGADERVSAPPEPEEIFSDDFESGNVSAWSSSSP